MPKNRQNIDKEKKATDLLEQAVESKDLPNVYFNGFAVSIGSGDAVIILQLNGKPVAVLNTSYTVAKTLVMKLGGIIDLLEKKTGRDIMTTDQVGEYLSKTEPERTK